jgi:hypothetical protein
MTVYFLVCLGLRSFLMNAAHVSDCMNCICVYAQRRDPNESLTFWAAKFIHIKSHVLPEPVLGALFFVELSEN